MNKSRLEAFSDGVIAILITIMVLELKIPHGADWESLQPIFPVFVTYVLSFVYIAIYWNNHHHLLQATKKINGAVLWANTHLLFWLSLIPFTTGWMGENHFEQLPTAVYGANLFAAGVAYTILQTLLIREHEANSNLEAALGKDIKGKISLVCYVLAIAFAFFSQWISGALYVLVALMWLVPDRRIESKINNPNS